MCGLFLLVAVAVAAHELVYAACGIDKLLLTGEEGVRCAGDLKFYEGIGYAIHFDCLLGGYGGTSDEDLVIGHVLEYYFTVVGRMDICFHFSVMIVMLSKCLENALVGRLDS